MTIIVSLNGTLVPLDEARISPLDRGFLFGDAIYDVIKCIDGQAFMYDEHLNRINNSLNGLQFPKLDLSSLLDEVKQVLQENALNKGIALLYLQISRGAYAARSHEFPKEEIKPTSFLMGSPCPVVPRKGLKLATQPDYRWGLCKYKTANLLGNVLAKQAVVGDGCDEVVLVKDDVALECSASALAIVADGGKVLTHPPADYMLPSISIIGLKEVCKNQGLDFVERPFSVEEVKSADEVLVLSSVRDVSQATILNGENVGDKDSATLAKLQDGFADLAKQKLS
ncbi:MAG: aminotransferase class IV [Gammaproteobacteria bacterium]|nr:aminotransferase class IV [Gammaproteobacteria bacterium]